MGTFSSTFVLYVSVHFPQLQRRRRKDYKDYNKANLERAVVAVIDGQMNAIQASHCYGVPSRTIYDRVAKARNEAKHKKDKDHPLQTLDNFKSELTSEIVNEKIEYILVNKLEQDQK